MQQRLDGPVQGKTSLWYAVLAAPLAWAAMLVVGYAVEDVIACTPGAGSSGEIWGFGVRPLLVVVVAILAGVTLSGLLVAVVRYRRLGRSDDSTGRVARWMALAGIINSVIFGIGIAAGFLPPLLLGVCQVTP